MLINPTVAGLSRRWGGCNRLGRGFSQAGLLARSHAAVCTGAAGLPPSPDLRPLVCGEWVHQAPGVDVTRGARQGGPVGRPRRPRAPAPTRRTCPGRGPEALSRDPAPPRPGRAACWLAEPERYANEPDPVRTCGGAAGPPSVDSQVRPAPARNHAALLPGENALQPQGPQLRGAGDAER